MSNKGHFIKISNQLSKHNVTVNFRESPAVIPGGNHKEFNARKDEPLFLIIDRDLQFGNVRFTFDMSPDTDLLFFRVRQYGRKNVWQMVVKDPEINDRPKSVTVELGEPEV